MATDRARSEPDVQRTGFRPSGVALMMKRWPADIVWQILAGTAVVCLMLITVVVVRREFFPAFPQIAGLSETNDGQRAAQAAPEPPVPVDDWARVSGSGHRIGPSDAPVTIVVFSDFQCPFCARFATQVLPALQKSFPGKVTMLFRHWPLSGHQWAYPAARAAECAADQGRFEQFHNAVFASQSALGTKPFVDYAKEAGVANLREFEKCTKVTVPLRSITEDVTEARRIGGRGTPTIVINGLRLRPPYSPEAIGERVRAAMDTKTRQ
jgi:protein-disulfide isomerase